MWRECHGYVEVLHGSKWLKEFQPSAVLEVALSLPIAMSLPNGVQVFYHENESLREDRVAHLCHKQKLLIWYIAQDSQLELSINCPLLKCDRNVNGPMAEKVTYASPYALNFGA
jgi:hypothetical protein